MDDRIDLFEKLVRFLAIKPLNEEAFNLEKAKEIIKEENKENISFIAQHGYFEDVLDTVEQRIGNLQPHAGTLYIYIKGDSSKKTIERNLLNLVLYVNQIYIVGKASDWSFNDPKINFLDIEDKFTPNHQRFLIFNSPSYNVALTARHIEQKGETVTEGALTNKKEAVTFLNQVLAPFSYKKNY